MLDLLLDVVVVVAAAADDDDDDDGEWWSVRLIQPKISTSQSIYSDM